MLKRLINYLKCLLFGCEQNSNKVDKLESSIKEKEDKLKDIENEKLDTDSIVDHFNNK
jgi:hypothetical protein